MVRASRPDGSVDRYADVRFGPAGCRQRGEEHPCTSREKSCLKLPSAQFERWVRAFNHGWLFVGCCTTWFDTPHSNAYPSLMQEPNSKPHRTFPTWTQNVRLKKTSKVVTIKHCHVKKTPPGTYVGRCHPSIPLSSSHTRIPFIPTSPRPVYPLELTG